MSKMLSLDILHKKVVDDESVYITDGTLKFLKMFLKLM